MVGMGEEGPATDRKDQNVRSKSANLSRSSSRERSPRRKSMPEGVPSCSRSPEKRSLSPEDPRASGSITLVAPPCANSKTAFAQTFNALSYKRRRINRKNSSVNPNSFDRGPSYQGGSNAPRSNYEGDRNVFRMSNTQSQHFSHRKYKARSNSRGLVKDSDVSECNLASGTRREVQRLGITRYTVEAFRKVAPSHINGMLLHQVEELRSGEKLCCRCGQRGHLDNQCADWKTQQCPSELRGSHRGRCNFSTTCQFTHQGEDIRRFVKQFCTKVCLLRNEGGTTIALVLGCMSTNHAIESCPYTITLPSSTNHSNDTCRRTSYSPTRKSRDAPVQRYKPVQKRRPNPISYGDRYRVDSKKSKEINSHSMASSSDMQGFLASSNGVYAPQSPEYAPSSPSFVAVEKVDSTGIATIPDATLDGPLCARDMQTVITTEDE